MTDASTTTSTQETSAIGQLPPRSRFDQLIRRTSVNLARLAVIIAILLSGMVLTRETLFGGGTIEVQRIDVPSELADAGYTPQVVAQHLIDRARKIQSNAGTTAEGSSFVGNWSLADFLIPTTGISMRSVAAYLRRDILGLQDILISGEIVYREPHYRLFLRINGLRVHPSCLTAADGEIDETLQGGAEMVLCAADPYILASYYYEKNDLVRVTELIEFILDARRGTDDETRAVNLQGIMLADDRRYDDAIAKYESATVLDPRFAIAYNNWGVALQDKNDFDGAIERYERAVQLDPTYAGPYNNWGNALRGKRDPEGAIEKYAKAVELDPTYASPHNNWGNALRDKGDPDGAIEKYARAVELDPSFAFPYNNWGQRAAGQG